MEVTTVKNVGGRPRGRKREAIKFSLDKAIVAKVRGEAAREGRPMSAVVEDALRNRFGLDASTA